MAQKPDLDGYVDVAERIAEFRSKHPEGSLQPVDPAEPYRMMTVDGATFVVVVAAAYRTPDDPRPGIGMAQELIPGRTPYTRGSELQNAETSAWGRAIVAALAADTKRGVASLDEVRNRRAEREAQAVPQVPANATQGQLQQLAVLLGDMGLTERSDRLTFVSGLVGRELGSSKELTPAEAKQVMETVRKQIAEDRAAEAAGH